MKVKSFVFSLLLPLGFVVFLFGSAFGQKSASFKELYDLKTEARKTLDTRPRRVVVQIQDFREPIGAKGEVTVYEYLAEDRVRLHRKLTEGKISTEFESIVVGEFQYIRENNGGWRKSNVTAKISEPTAGIESDGSSCAVREIEASMGYAGTLPAKIYFERAFVNGPKGIEMVIRYTWMGFDGSILKESEQRGDYFGGSGWSRVGLSDGYNFSITYEYDPRIKIETPIN